jgi:2-polyprenyl-3-methyl-5-hydroxy-6-metoxy-1,4-benzoquinol methylase
MRREPAAGARSGMSQREPSRARPTAEELRSLFLAKYGPPHATGWGPRRRFEFGYYPPGEVYEAIVDRYVTVGCRWLDVGGGKAIFPEHPSLARQLVARASHVVAVDPSDNVHRNEFVHERVQCFLETYTPDSLFDLVTLRMVVEHVADPPAFADALGHVVKPGGRVIVFTVSSWSPLARAAAVVPFCLHYPVKRFFWGGEPEDTFPVHYRMNTRRHLRAHLNRAGFQEELFLSVDDLSTFSRFKMLNYLELVVWRAMQQLGWTYPEHCLIAIYRRAGDQRHT